MLAGSPRSAVICMLLLSILAFVILGGVNTDSAYAQFSFDPVIMDPPVIDWRYPADNQFMTIDSEGSEMYGSLYQAQGNSTYPTVVLLHGYPGVEKSIDLAHAFRRAGWNSLVFFYRGAWGSKGEFSAVNALKDVENVVAHLRSSDVSRQFKIDPSRIILVGDSFGGWLSMMSVGSLTSVRCAASIQPFNMGFYAQLLASDPNFASHEVNVTQYPGPYNGVERQQMVDEMIEKAEELDYMNHAELIAQNRVLLIGGSRDVVAPLDMHLYPLVDALEAAGASDLTQVIIDDIHSVPNIRIELAQEITNWINDTCLN